jgi:hypothetical protein
MWKPRHLTIIWASTACYRDSFIFHLYFTLLKIVILMFKDGNLNRPIRWTPITVAARSRTWTVFGRSKPGIVGSNPTQGMDVCVCVYSVCVLLSVGSGLATGWSLVQGVLPTVLRIKKLKWNKAFHECPLLQKWEQPGRERETCTELMNWAAISEYS